MAKKTRISTAARLIPGSGLLTLLMLSPSLAGGPAVASDAASMAASASQGKPPPVKGPGLRSPAPTGGDPASQAGAAPGASSAASGAPSAPVPAAATGGANASGKPAHRNSVACLISPERTADVGTPVTGVVSDIRVERGDMVRRGQALVVLEQNVERAQVQAVAARHAIESDVRSAEANLVLAKERWERMRSLAGTGAVAALNIEQARAEMDVAAQRLQQASGQRQVVLQELGVAQAQLAQRTLRAPFDGVVVERLAQEGERVEDRPIVRVAQLDPLRLELVMPAARWGSVERGDAITLLPDLPSGGKLVAKVTHVDKTLDAASNTFRVRLVLPNPDYKVPAGARCRVDEPSADASPTANPARGA
ncbi:MAG: efflux RND transporter periplasmic adaptor subunit [Rubrivivax sp.]